MLRELADEMKRPQMLGRIVGGAILLTVLDEVEVAFLGKERRRSLMWLSVALRQVLMYLFLGRLHRLDVSLRNEARLVRASAEIEGVARQSVIAAQEREAEAVRRDARMADMTTRLLRLTVALVVLAVLTLLADRHADCDGLVRGLCRHSNVSWLGARSPTGVADGRSRCDFVDRFDQFWRASPKRTRGERLDVDEEDQFGHVAEPHRSPGVHKSPQHRQARAQATNLGQTSNGGERRANRQEEGRRIAPTLGAERASD
jgi:hypothetical protein